RFDLFVNADKRFTETIQFSLILAFCRLYHDRPRNREAQCRRMETIIHQTLGYVFGFDTADILKWTNVHDKLMCTYTMITGIEDRIKLLQSRPHIIGIENS